MCLRLLITKYQLSANHLKVPARRVFWGYVFPNLEVDAGMYILTWCKLENRDFKAFGARWHGSKFLSESVWDRIFRSVLGFSLLNLFFWQTIIAMISLHMAAFKLFFPYHFLERPKGLCRPWRRGQRSMICFGRNALVVGTTVSANCVGVKKKNYLKWKKCSIW